MRERLPDLDVQRALGRLPAWSRRGDALVKTYQFASFPAAIAVVNAVAEEAERRQHHPDMDIRYTRVTFHLSTHDAGGITALDLSLAEAIERIVADARQ